MINTFKKYKYRIFLLHTVILLTFFAFFGHSNILSGSIDESLKWNSVEVSSHFPGRCAHKSVVFKNKLWIIGGWDGSTAYNDIWNSNDGVNWEVVTKNAPFSKRTGFSLTKFKGSLWLIGGLNFDNNENIIDLNDVWKSSDGVNWTKVTSHAPFSPRGGHSSVVFKNDLYLIGGISQNSDIWKTADGVRWVKIASNPEFGGRGAHTTIVFKNKLWTIGGFYVDKENNTKSLSDVWESKDGITWKKTLNETSFFAGGGHSCVVYNNKIWIMGGFRKRGAVFSSVDGVIWDKVQQSGDFGERVAHSTITFKNSIWIIGGYNGAGYKDDIWKGMNETLLNNGKGLISLNGTN